MSWATHNVLLYNMGGGPKGWWALVSDFTPFLRLFERDSRARGASMSLRKVFQM